VLGEAVEGIWSVSDRGGWMEFSSESLASSLDPVAFSSDALGLGSVLAFGPGADSSSIELSKGSRSSFLIVGV